MMSLTPAQWRKVEHMGLHLDGKDVEDLHDLLRQIERDCELLTPSMSGKMRHAHIGTDTFERLQQWIADIEARIEGLP